MSWFFILKLMMQDKNNLLINNISNKPQKYKKSSRKDIFIESRSELASTVKLPQKELEQVCDEPLCLMMYVQHPIIFLDPL